MELDNFTKQLMLNGPLFAAKAAGEAKAPDLQKGIAEMIQIMAATVLEDWDLAFSAKAKEEQRNAAPPIAEWVLSLNYDQCRGMLEALCDEKKREFTDLMALSKKRDQMELDRNKPVYIRVEDPILNPLRLLRAAQYAGDWALTKRLKRALAILGRKDLVIDQDYELDFYVEEEALEGPRVAEWVIGMSMTDRLEMLMRFNMASEKEATKWSFMMDTFHDDWWEDTRNDA